MKKQAKQWSPTRTGAVNMIRISRRQIQNANLHVDLNEDGLTIAAQRQWPSEAHDAFLEFAKCINLTDRQTDQVQDFAATLQLWDFLKEISNQ